MTGVPDAAVAIAPVRAALLDRAREHAGRVLEEAEREAAAIVADARREAAGILEDARAAGRAEGEAAVAVERSRGCGRARVIVLAARREAYDELRREVLAGVRDLCRGPHRPTVVARLRAVAEGRLGAAAVIEEAPGGGITARTPGAELDLSADTLAEQAVAALGTEVTKLWDLR